GTDRQVILRRVSELAQPIADRMGLELVDVELEGQGARTVLRILVDREGGVSVEDCARLSERLSRQLDVEDLFLHRYTLEVASPGLDRPLRRTGDFDRFAGRLVEVTTVSEISGQRHFTGRLRGIVAGRVVVDLGRGREAHIPLEEIAQARLRVDPEEIRRDLRRRSDARSGNFRTRWEGR
ncbi:MAG: ribosome maturation factor RimP, partial [Armatimonadota bacterium]|nr:ribosome maturation factor RimP [Armatimonadota bacterium]